jgi:hypothetical protein
MIIIMRATLHDHAPNTYYGQWPGKKALFAGLKSPAIAHNELAASAGFVAFDVPERDFPGNRSPLRWKFACRPKRKICAPGEVARSLAIYPALFSIVPVTFGAQFAVSKGSIT